MQLTFIATIQLAIGLAILLKGSLRSAFIFIVACGLFAGSAVIVLPALGGSSIPPVQVAIVLSYVLIFAGRDTYLPVLGDALRANRWLAGFTLFGMASAVLAPRLFAGTIQIAPLRPTASADMFETVMLGPTSQNLTTAFYLFGTLLVALGAFVLCRACRGGVAALVDAVVTVGWAHILIGLAVMAARGTPLDPVFEMLRNGNYAQLDQAHNGFVRIRGLFPEPSGFAEFGFALFVVNAELWYRSIRPAATGAVAFALAMVLAFSTSSTAYVGLFAYMLLFVLRALTLPHVAPGLRIRQFLAATLGISVIGSIMMIAVPSLPIEFGEMVSDMTVGKSSSGSGEQRLFWAMQGWEAFKASYGLGIGPGSFRSSSLLTAILGSTGVIGVFTFVVYLLSVLQPWRRSTWGSSAQIEDSLGGAFAVASVLALIPAAVASAKADPGIMFALFAGAALALRPVALWRRQTRPTPEPAEPAGELGFQPVTGN
ncbi:MAG: glycoside hydrolase [Croceibacterium sp.]